MTNIDEINLLLQDIYDYIHYQRRKIQNNLKINDNDKKCAKCLIERSKKELEKIVAINNNNKHNNYSKKKSDEEYYDIIEGGERYVDMSKNISPLSVDLPPKLPPKKNLDINKEFPAKEILINTNKKCGLLLMRRKVFSIIERSSKVFCAIHQNFLLIYWSNKDIKPFLVINLKNYEAKEDQEYDLSASSSLLLSEGDNKNIKIASTFKVFLSNNNNDEKNCYNFVASSHKDMLEWVIYINKCHDNAVRVNNKNLEDIYEIFEEPLIHNNTDEENIYNEIDNKFTSNEIIINDNNNKDNNEKPPELPAKPILRNEIINNDDKNNSVVKYYEVFNEDNENYDEVAEEEIITQENSALKIKWNKPWNSFRTKNTTPINNNNNNNRSSIIKQPRVLGEEINIVKIIRQKRTSLIADGSSPMCNLETFSNNSKFDHKNFNFLKESSSSSIKNSCNPNENSLSLIEKPMVLLKNIVEDDNNVLDGGIMKKLKKSPIKKISKKLTY